MPILLGLLDCWKVSTTTPRNYEKKKYYLYGSAQISILNVFLSLDMFFPYTVYYCFNLQLFLNYLTILAILSYFF